MRFFAGIAVVGLARIVCAAYSLADDYSGNNFFNSFNFEIEDDPTNGYVNYLSKEDARNAELWDVENGVVTMRVDSTNIASGRGRNSIRVSTSKTYQHALVVLSLTHMPGNACGIWPAFWMLGSRIWPINGEIDVIEGVNYQSQNIMTVHTSDGCSQAGESCLANKGCRIGLGDPQSYGDSLNNVGGGVYAVEWTSDHVKIWFWPKNESPSDVGGANPNPVAWRTPTANFQQSHDCIIDQHFNDMRLIFDTTFCGDWAGHSLVFGADGECGEMTCQDYVQKNPHAYENAYWSVDTLKVYSFHDTASPATAVTTDPPATTTVQPLVELMSDGHWNVGYDAGSSAERRRIRSGSNNRC